MALGSRKPKYSLYVEGCYLKKGRTCMLNHKNLDRLLDYARKNPDNLPFILTFLGSRTRKYVEKHNISYLQVSSEIYKSIFYECFAFVSPSWFTLLIDISLLMFDSPVFSICCLGLELFATFYVIPINVTSIALIIRQGKKLAIPSLQYTALPPDRSDTVSSFLRDNQDFLLRGIGNLVANLTKFNPRYPLLDILALHFSATRCFLWLYFTYCTLLPDTGEGKCSYRNLAGALIIAYSISKDIKYIDNIANVLQPYMELGRVLLQKNVETLLDYYNMYQRILNNALSNKQIMLKGPMSTPPGLPSSFVATEKNSPWSDLLVVLECSAKVSAKTVGVSNVRTHCTSDSSQIFPDQGVLCYWRLLIKSFALVFGEQTDDARGAVILKDSCAGTLYLIEELVPILYDEALSILTRFCESRTRILFTLLHTLYGSNRMLTHVPSIFHWVQHHMLTSRMVSAMMLRLITLELTRFKQMCMFIGAGIQVSSVYLHSVASALLADCPYALFSLILTTILSSFFDSQIKMDVIQRLMVHCAEQDTITPGFLVDFLVSTNVEKSINDELLLQMRTDVSFVAIELFTSFPNLNNDLSRVFFKRMYTLLHQLRTFFLVEVAVMNAQERNAYDLFLSHLHDLLIQHTIVIVSTGIHNSRVHFNILMEADNQIQLSTELDRRYPPQAYTDNTSAELSRQIHNSNSLDPRNVNEKGTSSTCMGSLLHICRAPTADDINSLSLTSSQSLNFMSAGHTKGALKMHIFTHIRTSRFWNLLTKIASQHFSDELLSVKNSIDHLILDFLTGSCFKAFVMILQGSSTSAGDHGLKEATPAYSTALNIETHDNSLISTFAASIFQPDSPMHVFEPGLSVDHESSAGTSAMGMPYADNNFTPMESSEYTTDPGSLISAGRSSTSAIGYSAFYASDYLGAVSSSRAPQAPLPMTRIAPQHALTPMSLSVSADVDGHHNLKGVQSAQSSASMSSTRQVPSLISHQTVVATVMSEAVLIRTLLSSAQEQTIFYFVLLHSNLIGDTLRLGENKGGFISNDFWRRFSQLLIDIVTDGFLTKHSLKKTASTPIVPIFILHSIVAKAANVEPKQVTQSKEPDTGFTSVWNAPNEAIVETSQTLNLDEIDFSGGYSFAGKLYAPSIFKYFAGELAKAPNYEFLPQIFNTVYPDIAICNNLGYICAIVLISAPNLQISDSVSRTKQQGLNFGPMLFNDPSLHQLSNAADCALSRHHCISTSSLEDGCLLAFAQGSSVHKHSVRKAQSSVYSRGPAGGFSEATMPPILATFTPTTGAPTQITPFDGQLGRSTSIFNDRDAALARLISKKDAIQLNLSDIILQDSGKINNSQYISRSFMTNKSSNTSHSFADTKSLGASNHRNILFVNRLREGVEVITRMYTALAQITIIGKQGTADLIDELYVKIPLATIALWITHSKTISEECLLSCFTILFIYVCSRDPPAEPHKLVPTNPQLHRLHRSHERTSSTLTGGRYRASCATDIDIFEAPEVQAFLTELCKRYENLHQFLQSNVSGLLSVLLEAFYKHIELTSSFDGYVVDALAAISTRITKCCKYFECPERANVEHIICTMPQTATRAEFLTVIEKLSKVASIFPKMYFEDSGDSLTITSLASEAEAIHKRLLSTYTMRTGNPSTPAELYFECYLLPSMVVKRLLVNQLALISTLLTRSFVDTFSSIPLLLNPGMAKHKVLHRAMLVSELLRLTPKHASSDTAYILSLLTGMELTFQLASDLYEYSSLCITEAHTEHPAVVSGSSCTKFTPVTMEKDKRINIHENYAFILDFD